MPSSSPNSSNCSVKVKVTILKATGLAAMDKNLFGKSTRSDPYVKVCYPRRTRRGSGMRMTVVGQTSVQKKTLNPVWNESFSFKIDKFSSLSSQSQSQSQQKHCLELRLFDRDITSADDPMGTAVVPLPIDFSDDIITTTQWYAVDPRSAKKAAGKIQVKIQTTLHRSVTLRKGNALSVAGLTARNNNKLKVGLSWDMLGNTNVDLDASCVALLANGQVSMEQTVYYGNPANPNESIVHSGDEQEGDEEGDDESIMLDLNRIPRNVMALYLILTVATPGMKLGQIQSTQFRLAEVPSDQTICTYRPANHALSRDSTAMFMVRIAREGGGEWIVRPIEDTHPTARDFGGLIPYLKSYTRDLIPSLPINPSERVAILRKHGNIRLTDYSKGASLPNPVTFGLAWDITGGKNIDLDASAICLDSNLNLVDTVYFKHLRSNDGAITHHGDEREGDEVGDDEKMDIYLNRVSSRIQYIGVVINSYSGEELDDVSRAACHLFNPQDHTDIASYALTNSSQLDKHTALVVGCLYRGSTELPGDWCLCIISEAAQGRTVRDNVDELQNYLRRNPPVAPSINQPQEHEAEIVVAGETYHMPTFVPYQEPASTVIEAATTTTTSPAATPSNGGSATPPKKMININGVTRLNPEVCLCKYVPCIDYLSFI